MAYIPPHKRNPGSLTPCPLPDSLVPQFKNGSKLIPSRPNWFIVGKSDDGFPSHIHLEPKLIPPRPNWFIVGKSDDEFPSYIHLEPTVIETIERQTREKPLILVNVHKNKEVNEVQGNASVRPWIEIAENVQKYLLLSFDALRKQMESQNFHDTKPKLVTRFGKILFNGSDTFSLDAARTSPALESTLRQLRRTFYTRHSASYSENILNDASNIGLAFVKKKDTYFINIKLSDGTESAWTIICKCTVDGDKKLQLYKVERDPVRHMVVDTSCIDKDLDLRHMLFTKKILRTPLTDDDMHNIKCLLNSAIIDSNVRGGLSWPLGKSVFGEKYKYEVHRIWRNVSTIHKSASLKLIVRNVDRSDFIFYNGESIWETEFYLKELVSELQKTPTRTQFLIC